MRVAHTMYDTFAENILQVVFRSGDEYECICPFHADTKPSFRFNIVKGAWICHACGEHGSAKTLAERLNVPLVVNGASVPSLRDRLARLNQRENLPVELPESYLTQFSFPTDYWEDDRGFSFRSVRTWELGYDPQTDSATIPFRNKRGRLLGVIRRRLAPDTRPRYLYPAGVPIGKHLFGAWKISPKPDRKVAICEGPLDAIACWDSRVPALAMLGCRLTRDQVRVLRQLGIQQVTILTDNDEAGWGAIEEIHSRLEGIAVRVGWYRPYWLSKDPAELSDPQRRKMYHSAPTFRDWQRKQIRTENC